ncbi:hypothetical protein MTO96_001420 [Rhipicephalus appendiculatus]
MDLNMAGFVGLVEFLLFLPTGPLALNLIILLEQEMESLVGSATSMPEMIMPTFYQTQVCFVLVTTTVASENKTVLDGLYQVFKQRCSPSHISTVWPSILLILPFPLLTAVG